VKVSTASDKTLLALTNNGSPIPVADRTRIFEPFFTSKRAQGGTGIGLAIARSLIRGYGGTLELGAHDEGVTFIIEVPRATPP
jgi:signal transduction histidine kinase